MPTGSICGNISPRNVTGSESLGTARGVFNSVAHAEQTKEILIIHLLPTTKVRKTVAVLLAGLLASLNADAELLQGGLVHNQDHAVTVNILDEEGPFNSTTVAEAAVEVPLFQDGFESPPPPDIVLVFSASPELITEGESTSLSWAVQNAASCTPSDGTGGWDQVNIVLPDGSVPISIETADSYEFTLTCEADYVASVAESVTVVVDPKPCDKPALSGGGIKLWEDFWLVDFPNPVYDNRDLFLPRKSYMAISFNTGDVFDDGKFTLLETTASTGLRLGTISTCPGEFKAADECKYIWGLGGGIRWATNNRSGACQLNANTDYYFNVTFTDGVDGSTSSCDEAKCKVVVQHVKL